MADAVTNSPAAAPVPEAALDRILEALSRSRKYLDAEKSRKLDELFSLDTLLAFGVLLAIWAGFQLTPIGWIADTVLALYGTYQLGSTLADLIGAAKEAAYAATNQALDLAAQHLARAMTDTVVDIITVILGAAAFGKLRALLRSVRSRILPKGSRFLESETGARPKAEEPLSRPKAADYAIGGATALGLQSGAVAIGGNPWPWLAGLAALAGLGLVVAGAASHRSSARRRAYG